MQPFDYYVAKNYEEAFHYLTLPGKQVYPLAGGTDFIPMYRDGLWKADAVVDIKNLDGMRDLRETSEGLFIGAAVCMNDLAQSPLVKSHWDILAQGASVVGSDQVRNRATVGGNICTASPCADTPPALYVLEAIVLIRGKSGERRVPIRDFATFVRKTIVQKGELIVGLLIPKPANGTVGVYEKLSRRKGSDLAVVSTAALAAPREDGGYTWRIALGAVAPTIIRVPEAEAILSKGHTEADVLKAAEAAALASRPISDVRASEVYRRTMVRNVTRRAIQKVLAKLA